MKNEEIKKVVRKIDLISCMKFRGEYNIKDGTCSYYVRINRDGKEEFVR